MSLSSARADILVALDAGLLGVADVLAMASDGDEAAKGLSLRQVLVCAHTPHIKIVLSRYQALAGGLVDPPLRYVVEPKAHGRRIAALGAALNWRTNTWPGFPYTTAPQAWLP